MFLNGLCEKCQIYVGTFLYIQILMSLKYQTDSIGRKGGAVMIEEKLIDKEHQKDINIPNEPFALWGRMIPAYMSEKWSYTVEHFAPQDC